MSTVEFPLRMLIDKEKNEVLFAEANSDFVDILLSFLTLPMGTIIRLLSKSTEAQPAALGSLNNINKSISDLENKYFGSQTCKDMLLKPKNSSEELCSMLQLNIDDTEPTRYYICENLDCSRKTEALLCTYNTAICKCGKPMIREINREVSKQSSANVHGVFVTKDTTFLLKEGFLCVYSISTNATDFPLSNIRDFQKLEEKTVNVGYYEILNLLKNSIFSMAPLTRTLLAENKSLEMVDSQQSRSTLPPQVYVEENAAESEHTVHMSVRIFVQKSNDKVLFAEVHEDFVEFLFSFLTIPLGKVMDLLRGDASLGSMDNFYECVSNWDVYSTSKSKELKENLVSTPLASQYLSRNNCFSLEEATTPQFFFSYSLSYSGGFHLTLTRGTSSYSTVNTPLTLIDPKVEGCFVKKPAMFMVTDDLVVTPFSYISSICLLNRLQISRGEVLEQVVEIGKQEALNILKASLNSSEVLTTGLKHIVKELNKERVHLKVPKQEK